MKAETIVLRKNCKCGSTVGYVKPKNGQDCVYCDICKEFQYNRPKAKPTEVEGGPPSQLGPWGSVPCGQCRQPIAASEPTGLCDKCKVDVLTHNPKPASTHPLNEPCTPNTCKICKRYLKDFNAAGLCAVCYGNVLSNGDEALSNGDEDILVPPFPRSIEGEWVQREPVLEREPLKAKSDRLAPGVEQVPYEGIEAIGEIFSEGAVKYGVDNWKKGVGDKDYQTERCRHAIRHLLLWANGDRSEPHLAKVAWFCVTQIWTERQNVPDSQ